MRKILAAGVFIAVLFIGRDQAAAQSGYVFPPNEAPWCAVYSLGGGNGGGDYWDCRYATLEACVPYVIAGNRGFCNMNPRFPGWNGSAQEPGRRFRRGH